MIEQGDYMVVNLASIVGSGTSPEFSSQRNPNLDLVSGGQFQPKHIAWYYLLRFLDLKRSLNIRILYLNEEPLNPSSPLLPSHCTSVTTCAASFGNDTRTSLMKSRRS